MRLCCFCNSEWTADGKPGFRDTCTQCGHDIHICLNCKFYDATLYNNCREPIAEKVTQSDVANFCTHFVYIDSTKNEAKKNDPKQGFYNLFSN